MGGRLCGCVITRGIEAHSSEWLDHTVLVSISRSAVKKRVVAVGTISSNIRLHREAEVSSAFCGWFVVGLWWVLSLAYGDFGSRSHDDEVVKKWGLGQK